MLHDCMYNICVSQYFTDLLNLFKKYFAQLQFQNIHEVMLHSLLGYNFKIIYIFTNYALKSIYI